MTRCASPGCRNYGRELKPEEYEHVPAAATWVCSVCWCPVTNPPSDPPAESAESQRRPAPVAPPPPILSTPSISEAEILWNKAAPTKPLTPEAPQPLPASPPVPQLFDEPLIESLDDLFPAANPLPQPPVVAVSPPPGPPVVPSQPPPPSEPPVVSPNVKVIPERPLDPVMPQETKLPSEPAAGELLGAIEFPHIIVYQGGKERARYRMQGDEFTIGRQSDAGLPSIDFGRYTDGQKVSRRHAVIYQRDGRYWIEDVKSANHTWVNGEYLPPYKARELFDGDVISISGVADLAFELPPALAAAVEDAAGAAQA